MRRDIILENPTGSIDGDIIVDDNPISADITVDHNIIDGDITVDDNTVDTPIIPERPNVVKHEQFELFAPLANYRHAGMASFDPNSFIVENGRVKNRTNLAKAITDFVIDQSGKTISLHFNDGSVKTTVIPDADFDRVTNALTLITISEDSWIEDIDGEEVYYYFVATSEVTGRNDSNYFVSLEVSDNAYDPTIGMVKSGHFVMNESCFKASDGSLLICSNAPFTGRVLVMTSIFTNELLRNEKVADTEEGTIYNQVFKDGTTVQWLAPKGPEGTTIVCEEILRPTVNNIAVGYEGTVKASSISGVANAGDKMSAFIVTTAGFTYGAVIEITSDENNDVHAYVVKDLTLLHSDVDDGNGTLVSKYATTLTRTMRFGGVTPNIFTATKDGEYTFTGTRDHHAIGVELFTVTPLIGSVFFGTVVLKNNNSDNYGSIATFTAEVTAINTNDRNSVVEYKLIDATIFHDGDVDDKIKDLNIENGEGLDSIVQKYSGEVDATHFGNKDYLLDSNGNPIKNSDGKIYGESAAIFGEANSNNANRALMAGKLNKNISANSITAGLENTSRGNHSLTVGTNNDVQNTSSVTAGIRNIITVGNRNFVAGYDNELSTVGDSVVVGNNNDLSNVDGVIATGANNSIKPKTGSNCDYMLVGGENHTITDAKRGIVAGNTNTIASWNTITTGMNNTVNHSNTIVGGFQNQTSKQNQAVFGEYNDYTSIDAKKALLIVGKGTSDNDRKNAFEVLTDGRARVLTAPSGETDVVRKKELDALESKLNTVSNVMDFVGAKESLPTSGDYQSGDVIVVTKGDDAGKEFVYDGENWVEFGYSDSLNTAIARLQESKVDKVEGEDLIATSEITRLAGMSDGANKVEPSETNGHIKIDGAETTVYDDSDCVKLSDVTGDDTNDEILRNIAAALIDFMPWYEGEVETT